MKKILLVLLTVCLVFVSCDNSNNSRIVDGVAIPDWAKGLWLITELGDEYCYFTDDEIFQLD